jgi:hypothetical protein
MEAHVVHSTPSTTGPFLRLILALTSSRELKAVENLESPTGESRELNVAPTSDHPLAQPNHVSVNATTLGPFLTLLLTLHNRESWIERDWWEDSTAAPRGAILAAHYVSR